MNPPPPDLPPPSAPANLPPPSLPANLPPPAQHAPEVVVSTITRPPPFVAPKKEEDEVPDRPALDLAALIADAKGYALGKGRQQLLRVGTLLALAFAVAAKLSLAGIPITIVCAVYFGDYFYRIIATTLAGSDTPPDWPKTSEPVEELIRPGVRVVSAFLLGHIPLLIVYLNTSGIQRVNPIAWTIASAIPCVYFPFAAMMIVLQERFGASWPHYAFGAFKRCLPGAWSAVILCAVAVAAMRISQMIPVVGDFIGFFAMIACMMMLARNIGMLAAQHRHSLSELH